MESKKINRKLFCYLYLKLGNVYEAAIKAGFPPETAFYEGIKTLQMSSSQRVIKQLSNSIAPMRTMLIHSGLERLAFGNSNDAAYLVFSEELPSPSQISGLDLFNVSEIKRVKGGGVDVKLFDRQKALEKCLTDANSSNSENSAVSFINALRGSDNLEGEDKLMKFKKFSQKQQLAIKWWSTRKYCCYDAIICDGAVRSGKTMSMSIGFISWAMTSFQNGAFAICGKTITSLKRNVMTPLIQMMGQLGFTCIEKVSKNYIDITLCNITNRFYLFGGKDSASASLIQGITLCGVFLDEVALMPRSFVEQALARCSVTGSKLWFNCNPDNPYHWFYKEWIKKAGEKKALYLHFKMKDNPSLSKPIRERYERLYSGVFYDRFILVSGHPQVELFTQCSIRKSILS